MEPYTYMQSAAAGYCLDHRPAASGGRTDGALKPAARLAEQFGDGTLERAAGSARRTYIRLLYGRDIGMLR